jgi:hypothetical protein
MPIVLAISFRYFSSWYRVAMILAVLGVLMCRVVLLVLLLLGCRSPVFFNYM